MDKLLEMYNLPKLNQREKEISRPNTSMEIKTAIKNLPTNKSSGPNGFTDEFYQKFKEEPTTILLIIFWKVAEDGKLPNSSCEATITLKPKPDKGTTKKKTSGQYN